MFSMLARSLTVGLFAAGTLFGAAEIASADDNGNGDYGVWHDHFSTSKTVEGPKISVPTIPAPERGIEGGPLATAGEWIRN